MVSPGPVRGFTKGKPEKREPVVTLKKAPDPGGAEKR
jgi:hypothetical protein